MMVYSFENHQEVKMTTINRKYFSLKVEICQAWQKFLIDQKIWKPNQICTQLRIPILLSLVIVLKCSRPPASLFLNCFLQEEIRLWTVLKNVVCLGRGFSFIINTFDFSMFLFCAKYYTATKVIVFFESQVSAARFS